MFFIIDCWNIEPDNRPTINQVVDKLKVIIAKENIIINDFHLYNNIKDIKSSNNHQPNLDVAISKNINSVHGDLSQIINRFDEMSTKEIETSKSLSNHIENSFNIVVNDIIFFLNDDNNNV